MNPKEYHKQYHAARIEKWREYNKADYQRRKEEIRKKRQSPKYRKRLSEYLKKWRAKNVEKRKLAMREWQAKNKAHMIEYRKEYGPRRLALYQEQREKICAQKRAAAPRYRDRVQRYQRMKRKDDIQFAIKDRLRATMSRALRRQFVKKSKRTFELIGCTPTEFKSHLEKLFLPGMTWENRNLWHIDHKRPLASFDLKDIDQQKLAFHFSNTQPLWGPDNQRKSAKWSG